MLSMQQLSLQLKGLYLPIKFHNNVKENNSLNSYYFYRIIKLSHYF